MAGKRSATSELNHTNWDNDDEPEERGTFKTATQETLSSRVIKTARRRNPIRQEENDTKSAFVGFTGFSKPASTDFSFLKEVSKVDTTPKTNGIGNQDVSKPDLNINPFTQNSTVLPFGSKTFSNSNIFNINLTSSNSPTVPKLTFGGTSESEKYYSRLKGLNESVSKWIVKKVEENPLISLQPIFKDYEKYLAEIESGDGKKSENVAVSTSTPTFNFVIPNTKAVPDSTSEKTETKLGGSSTTSSVGNFVFGSNANTDGTSKSFSSLTSSTSFTSSLAPTMSFSSASSTNLPTPGGGETFSGNSGFSFESTTKPESGSKSQDNEDAEDEPPKVEVTPVVEKDYVYTVRCKVFVKKGADYVDKGVGNLYLKSIENSEKKQLIVRADTNLGNLLLNFILSESVPTKRLGKKDVMVVAVPTPDEKPPPTPLLLRVKSPEEADNLLDTLEKNKK